MQKTVILFFILSFIAFDGMSQKRHDRPPREKIESARIALITNRLNLTPEQAQVFWPVYNEFTDKRRAIGAEFEDKRRAMNKETATEEEKRALLELGMTVKEKQLQLEKEYSDKLLEVISVEQMINLRKAEEEFRRMLLEQLQKRQQRREKNHGGGGGGKFR